MATRPTATSPTATGEDPQDPRHAVIDAVRRNDAKSCLLKTGELHGHFCPGSALGVMASLYGLGHPQLAQVVSDGMEDLVAIVEINACFVDGVQVVSGCTLGNNALVYRDLGRVAVTFAGRGRPTAVRVSARPDVRAAIERAVPEFFPLMETVVKDRAGGPEEEAAFKTAGRKAAFATLELPFSSLFDRQTVEADLPPRAPITPSLLCPDCGEQLMATKAHRGDDGVERCGVCAGVPFLQVDGRGIVETRGEARSRRAD